MVVQGMQLQQFERAIFPWRPYAQGSQRNNLVQLEGPLLLDENCGDEDQAILSEEYSTLKLTTHDTALAMTCSPVRTR